MPPGELAICRSGTLKKDCGSPARGALPPLDAGGNDPLAAIRSINALASADSSAMLVLVNFHRFLQSRDYPGPRGAGERGQAAADLHCRLVAGVQIPFELEQAFSVVEHELPDRSQLTAIARGVATEPGELPDGDGLEGVLEAAAG